MESLHRFAFWCALGALVAVATIVGVTGAVVSNSVQHARAK